MPHRKSYLKRRRRCQREYGNYYEPPWRCLKTCPAWRAAKRWRREHRPAKQRAPDGRRLWIAAHGWPAKV